MKNSSMKETSMNTHMGNIAIDNRQRIFTQHMPHNGRVEDVIKVLYHAPRQPLQGEF